MSTVEETSEPRASDRPAAPTPPATLLAPPRRARERGWLFASVQSLAGTVVIALFVITFAVQAFRIPSESMENTLLIGDYLLVDKVHYGQGGMWGSVLPYAAIRRGDVIVFRYPVHPSQHFVKRVIGLPGDRVRLINKAVYLNGQPLSERYVVHRSSARDRFRDDFPQTDIVSANVDSRWWLQLRSLVRRGELVVPPDAYFVMGDNRDISDDSRYWGLVPRENVIGRPLMIYWSVDGGEAEDGGNHAVGGRLSDLAYAVTRMIHNTRWDRTFRLVR